MHNLAVAPAPDSDLLHAVASPTLKRDIHELLSETNIAMNGAGKQLHVVKLRDGGEEFHLTLAVQRLAR